MLNLAVRLALFRIFFPAKFLFSLVLGEIENHICSNMFEGLELEKMDDIWHIRLKLLIV